MNSNVANFADQAVSQTVSVVDVESLADNIFRIRFECPPMAKQIRPGQFLMVRIHGVDDPLIGRPFALFDTDIEQRCVDFVFVTGGKMTQRLARLESGALLDVWGPLGNGFSMQSADHVLLVAGGIGYTPFLATAKDYLSVQSYGRRDSPTRNDGGRLTFCFGARSSRELVSLPEFQSLGIEVLTATDDGSAGHHGRVTDLLAQALDDSDAPTKRVLCCGPEPMMEAVGAMAQQRSVPCEVSLETPMACGIGICFTCVAKIRDENGQSDYRRTCVEGPVFDATCVEW